MNTENNTKGLSFIRLVPFLSMEFKQKLANGELEIKEYFNLHSNNAYVSLLAIIRDDVLRNGGKVEPIIYRKEPNTTNKVKLGKPWYSRWM